MIRKKVMELAELQIAAEAVTSEILELRNSFDDNAKFILDEIELLEKHLEGINSLRCEKELNLKLYA